MVFIYKMSKVLEKQNGINPTCYRKVYYRTVYYKTLKGKEGWKNLRCRKNGELLTKEKRKKGFRKAWKAIN